jgi:hypothetical protein
MVAVSRIALILAAFVLGNFFAIGILSAGKIFVDPSNFGFYSKWEFVGSGLAGFGLHLLISAFGSMMFVFIPTLLVLIFTEMLGIQSKWFYILTAGIGAVLLDFTCTRLPIIGGMRSFCVEESFSELLIATIAGIAAGYVFWRVAGRRAGIWRADMPSNTPLAA